MVDIPKRRVPAGESAERPRRRSRRPVWAVVAVLTVGVVGLLAIGYVSSEEDAPEFEPLDPDEVDWTSDLARDTYETMATVESIRMESTTDYFGGFSECSSNERRTTASHTALNGEGWVDIDNDGTIDAFREGSEIRISSSLVPEVWEVDDAWISIPATDEKLVELAMVLPSTREVVGLLAVPDPMRTIPATVQQLEEQAEGPTTDEGTETIDGDSVTRYRIAFTEGGGPEDPGADVYFDNNGRLRRIEFDGDEPDAAVLEVLDYDAPIEIDVDRGGGVARFTSVPLAAVTASTRVPSCWPPVEPTEQDVGFARDCLDEDFKEETVTLYAAGAIDLPELLCSPLAQ